MRAFRPRDIFHLRQLDDVAIAPDGSAIAYALIQPDEARKGYTSSIVRLGLDDGLPRALTRGPHDRKPWYAPDGRHLGFLRHVGGAPQVHLLPLAGGEAQPLTALREGVDAFAWGPHGRQVAVIAPVGPPGQTARQLFHFEFDRTWRQLSDDDRDHLYPTFAPDGRAIACLLRRADAVQAAIGLVPVDGGPWRLLTPWRAAWAQPVFAPDGETLYAFGLGADGEAALWRLHPGGEDPEQVAKAPWPQALAPYLCPDASPDVFVTGDGQEVIALLARGPERVLARCAPASGRWRRDETKGRRIQAFAATADGERTALLAGPPDQPPEALLRDESGRILLRSDHHELFLSDVSFAPLQPVGADGPDLLLPLPGGRPAPLVVLLGDLPDRATGNTSSLLAQALCGRGLAVLRVPLDDARASEAPADLLARIDRHVAAVRPTRQAVDTSRLGLCGEGQAGYRALLLLAAGAKVRAAAVFGAATDLVGLWALGHLAEATGLPELAPPWQQGAAYLERSPLALADRIDAPLLLVHGLEDDVVPPLQAEELERALRFLGRGVRRETIPGLGHPPLRRAPLRAQAQVLELIAGWLGDQLAQ